MNLSKHPFQSSLSLNWVIEADNGLHSSEREVSGKKSFLCRAIKKRAKIIQKGRKSSKRGRGAGVSELETKISDIEHKLAEGDRLARGA